MTRTVFAYTDSEAFGGAEEVLAILLSGLAGSGWRPTLLHSGAPGLDPLLERIAPFAIASRIVPAMPEGLRGAARAVGLARMLRVERPGVFHAHLTWPFSCKWALAAACAARVPAVLGTAQLFVNVPMGRPGARRYGPLPGGSIGSSPCRTTPGSATTTRSAGPSNGSRSSPTRSTWSGSPATRRVGPRGAGGRVGTPDRARPRASGGAEGTPLPPRGGPTACRACGSSARETGGCATSSLADADRLGVGDRVTFLGFRRDMDALLSACDLVVLPSLYEGLPLALIEAMAAGQAVVATDIGGTRELVVDGETGILVPPRDPAALAERSRGSWATTHWPGARLSPADASAPAPTSPPAAMVERGRP